MKITNFSGYFYITFKDSGKLAINKSFRNYDDALFALKKLK